MNQIDEFPYLNFVCVFSLFFYSVQNWKMLFSFNFYKIC